MRCKSMMFWHVMILVVLSVSLLSVSGEDPTYTYTNCQHLNYCQNFIPPNLADCYYHIGGVVTYYERIVSCGDKFRQSQDMQCYGKYDENIYGFMPIVYKYPTEHDITIRCDKKIGYNPEYVYITGGITCCDRVCQQYCDVCRPVDTDDVCSTRGTKRCMSASCQEYFEECTLPSTDGTDCGTSAIDCGLAHCDDYHKFVKPVQQVSSCTSRCSGGICSPCTDALTCDYVHGGTDLDMDGYDRECGDCDDSDRLTNPGKEEICQDGKDNDCDGTVDEGCQAVTHCTDGDSSEACCQEMQGTWIDIRCCGDDLGESFCSGSARCDNGSRLPLCQDGWRCVLGKCESLGLVVEDTSANTTDGDGTAIIVNTSGSTDGLASTPGSQNTISCTDQCTRGQSKCIDNLHAAFCGQNDNDACLEFGAPVSCDDQNRCTEDFCSNGMCMHKNNNLCTGEELFLTGIEQPANRSAEIRQEENITRQANRPPVMRGIDNQRVYVGDTLDIYVNAVDPDNDPLMFSIESDISSMPPAISADGRIVWMASATHLGIHRMTVHASDGISRESQNFLVAVAEKPDSVVGKERITEALALRRAHDSIRTQAAQRQAEIEIVESRNIYTQRQDISTVERLVQKAYSDPEILDGLRERYNRTSNDVTVEKVAAVVRQTGQGADAGEKTVIHLVIRPKGVVENLTIIEEIPKAVAASAGLIRFTHAQPIILEDDPLVMWQFAKIEEDIDLSYELSGAADLEEVSRTNTVIISDASTGSSLWKILFPIVIIPMIILMYAYFVKFRKDVDA